MAESTSKLRAQVAALTNVSGKGGFDIMQDEDTFKSVYDIMLGISKVWDDMTDVKQSALLELIAGKVRSNQVAALLNNMSRAEEILHTSENSEGTMEEVHARWLDSIAAKQAQMTASWENLSQTMVNSDLVKWFYDFGNGAISVLDQVMSKIGSFGAVFAAGGTALFGSIGKQMNDGKGTALTGLFNSLTDLHGKKTGRVSEQFISAYNDVYSKTLDQQQAVAAATEAVGRNMNEAEMFAVKYSNGLITVGKESTIAGMKLQALSGVFKSVMASMATGLILAGVSALATFVMNEWDKAANAGQYAVQAADDASAAYKESQDDVKSLESELSNLEAQYQALIDKGPLNFADEQTKSDLKEQTEELRSQLELAKEIEKINAAESYRANKKAWATKYNQNSTFAGFVSRGVDELWKGNYHTAGALLQSTANDTLGNELTKIEKYVSNGPHTDDVVGSLKLISYLNQKIQEQYDKINNISQEDPKRDDWLKYYQGYIDRMNASAESLKGQMLKTYDELNTVLSTMRKAGEQASQEYQQYENLRNNIGEAIIPKQHQERKLLELRENKSFNETYKELEKLAETTEITTETLNDQKYNTFREELKDNGIEIKNLIVLLNELRKNGGQSIQLSVVTASDLKDKITGLLGNRDTGASIFKNTGYGTNGISEDDYQKLVDMNDVDLLKSVENSHGTMWFNEAKFNNILTKKITEQYYKMYEDMKRKQSEYVKETEKLNGLLRDHQKAQTKEEIKELQSKIGEQVKTLDNIKQEINLYNRLSAQIKASSTSFSKWKRSKDAPQEGDDYDEALEAYKELQEGYKSGRVGNASYQAAQEYLLGANANYYGSKEQQKILKRYLSKSAPGSSKDTGWGAKNFQKDAQKAGILDENYRLTRDWTSEDIAKKMGIGPELVNHLFGELNEFIGDASKKYKLKSTKLEDQAQGPDYAEYLKASQAFSDAVAAYNQNPDEKSFENLKRAWENYHGIAQTGDIETQNYERQQLRASNAELKSATEQNTAALTALTSMIAGFGLGGFGVMGRDGKFVLTKDGKPYLDEDGKEVVGTEAEIATYIAKLADKNDNLISDTAKLIKSANDALSLNNSPYRINMGKDENGNDAFNVIDGQGNIVKSYDSFVAALVHAFDDMAKNAKNIEDQVNSEAAKLGIKKRLEYDPQEKKWKAYDPDHPDKYTTYDRPEGATAEIFAEYAQTQRDNAAAVAGFVKALQNKEITFDLGSGTMLNEEGISISIKQGIVDAVSGSMSESGASFGQAAIDAINSDLEHFGIAEKLGLDENGAFTLGSRKFENAVDAFAAVAEKIAEATGASSYLANENMINDVLTGMGKTNLSAKYDEKAGKYVITDSVTGMEKSFATAALALNDIAGAEVASLADAFAQFNGFLNDAKSNLNVTIENGVTTITNVATGEKQTVSSLAEAAGSIIDTASNNLRSVADDIATLSNTLGGLQEISVQVTASGEFKIVDKDGKQLGDVIGEVGELVNTALATPLSQLNTAVTTLNNLANPSDDPNGPGIGLGPKGWLTYKDGVELVNKQFSTSLEAALKNISAKSVADAMAQVMGGSFGIDKDGQFKYNGNLFDTFEKLINESWDPSKVNTAFNEAVSGFTNAAADDAGAFKKNQSAVESATSALGAFNAALAAASLNQMLAHTGKKGSFQAGPNNTVMYYDDMGINRGIFTDMETAMGTMFGDFGEWLIETAEDGTLLARKKYTGKDGKYGDYTQPVGNITDASLDNGVLKLNKFMELKNNIGAPTIESGELVVEANGVKIDLGKIGGTKPVIDDNGNAVTQFYDTNGGTILNASGAYAYANGRLIQRPDTNGLLAGGQITSNDVTAIMQLIDYVHAAGEHADDEAKALEENVRRLIDEDPTGRYFDLFGANAQKYGFTRTEKEKQDKLAEEAARQAQLEEERKRKEQQEALDKARRDGRIELEKQLRERRTAELVEKGERYGQYLMGDEYQQAQNTVSKYRGWFDPKKGNFQDFIDRLPPDKGEELMAALRTMYGARDFEHFEDFDISIDDFNKWAANEVAKNGLDRVGEIFKDMSHVLGLVVEPEEGTEIPESELLKDFKQSDEYKKAQEIVAKHVGNLEDGQSPMDYIAGIKDSNEKIGLIEALYDLYDASNEAMYENRLNGVGVDRDDWLDFVSRILAKTPEQRESERQEKLRTGVTDSVMTSLDHYLDLQKEYNEAPSDDKLAALQKAWDTLQVFADKYQQILGEPFFGEIMEPDSPTQMLSQAADDALDAYNAIADSYSEDQSKENYEALVAAWEQLQSALKEYAKSGESYFGEDDQGPMSPDELQKEYSDSDAVHQIDINQAESDIRSRLNAYNKIVDQFGNDMAQNGTIIDNAWNLLEEAIAHYEQLTGESWYSDSNPPISPDELRRNEVESRTDDAEESLIKYMAQHMLQKAEAGTINGNVDIMNRPVISGEKLTEAGWGDDLGDKATVYSTTYGVDDKIIHVTPILPNGKVLSPEELDDYINELIDSGNDLLEADKERNGLIIWEQDVGDNPDRADKLAKEFDEQLHVQQEQLYADVPVQQAVDQASEDLSETPVEVNVEAKTSDASNKMDTDLGHKSYDATVTVHYVDPGLGSGNYMESYAGGTSNSDAGTSLVDEEGAELIEHVNRGTYELGTDNGPRFTKLDKGDVVHTAEETKKIKRRGVIGRIFDAFRNGGVKGGKSFVMGNYMLTDSGGRRKYDVHEAGSGDGPTSPGPSTGSSRKKKSAGAKIKDALKWAEKFVDWIPTALDILKKKTTDFIKAAEKSIGYLAQNKELTNAIANVREEIDLNNQAVERYKKQANDFAKRAGLSSGIVKLIQEGAIDIKQYDENTRKAIQTYQTWWDKAKGCLDTIESLNDQMYDLSKQKLDNIVKHFGNIDDQLNEQIKTFNSLVKVKEEYGQEMVRDDYLDAIRLTKDVIENLEAEQKALNDELEEQVNSGVIKVGSDDWYNYAKQIEELNSTLSEAKIDLSELSDEVKNIALNNLSTSIYYLDNLQSKIEGLQQLRNAQGSRDEVNSYRTLISTGMEQIDNLRTQNSELEKQLEGLDILSEKYQEINNQIQDNEDKIMDIKASQEEWNDAILDLKIELLQKQNQKYQERLDLMKALNDLEDARQRRVLMYNNQTGFGYVQDEDAVEEAQDAVNDQMYNLIVNGLEAQKENNNIYDNMGNQLIPVQDMLASVDFTRYYDSINRGSENSTLLTNILKSIDLPSILEGTKGGDVSIDIGDIILNGVNDAEALGDAIIAQLPGYLVQAIYSKGS